MRTNNYSNILRQIYSLNDSALLDITNTAGQTADLPNNVVFKSDYTSVATDVANTTGFYVAIGSSNTEPSSNDTNLNSVLTSGFTSLITGPFYDFGSASVTSVLKITITAGDSDVTVGEFGWYYNGCLLDHTALPSPVTIAANTMKTFGYAMFNGLYDQHKMATSAGVGRPGSLGFGVGVFRGNSKDLEEMQLTPMEGCEDVTSDNYGNYVHANGSVMCFIPAFCYRIGQPTAPSYERDGSNALEIGPADLDGTDNWILHRAFIDGGKKKSGFFIDKYINSKSEDGLTAVSVKSGNPISLTTDTNSNTSKTMTGGTGKLQDAITFGRNRGDQYSCITSFQWSAISMLSLAHAQASTSTEFCAWYDSANSTNFPKGNNLEKNDVDDASITFTASDATSDESSCVSKAGSGVPFAKTTHNGQNCGISDVNGNKFQMCIGYGSFTSNTHYVLKESIKAHDITTSNVLTKSNYDQTSGGSIAMTYYWGADAFYTDSSGPNRALCGVMPKTKTLTKLKIFGDDNCYFNNRTAFAAMVGGRSRYGSDAGIFSRNQDDWSDKGNYYFGCRCAGYPADSTSGVGKPGQAGFGVGVFKGDDKVLADMQLTPMDGYDDPTNDNYGNYQHANGSVMCFVPAFCYRIGKSTAPSYARDGSNALEIGPAELDGTDNWILHRAFIDGGQKKSGFFIDKYINSKSSDGLTAVSVKNGNPISLTTNTVFNVSSTMTGGVGKVKDAITFGRSRGDQYSCITSFQWSAISMLSLAHAQASIGTEFCAWYDSTNTTNFAKGNNNVKVDIDDASITFVASSTPSGESNYYTKAGSGAPFAKTTHNGQNCGISDVNGNKRQMCIGYCSFSNGTNYVLKESIRAHDITVDDVSTKSNYDQAVGYSSTGTFFWGANAFYTDSSGPNRAMCGVMPKTQTSTKSKIFGDDVCYFNSYSNFAAYIGGDAMSGDPSCAGIFYRGSVNWLESFSGLCGCRCAGYPDETPNVGVGVPGTVGFGVGVYPGTNDELKAAGLMPMRGYSDPTSDNYGNYQHANGSIMCFVPAFCYRIGKSTAPSYARDGSNALEIGPAELDGTDNWILHRAFIDGGEVKSGFFIDKYINSKSEDGLTAISVKNGNPISLIDSNYNTSSSTMTGGTGTLADAITFGRNRGEQYSCITSFQWSAISMLQLAHAQASTSTEFCAQYDASNSTNFPKGNNNTKKDTNDTSITFTASDATGSESKYQTKAGSGVPFAKTTHNGQNCGISDVNGNKWQMCIGYCSFSFGIHYVLKESIKAHDITTSNVSTKSNYDRAASYSSAGGQNQDSQYWGANAFYTDASGPNRAMCGVMPKTQTSSGLSSFGNDYCSIQAYSDFAAHVGGFYNSGSNAGIFCRNSYSWSKSGTDNIGCRCSGYLK